jgi:hypothetical protein
MPFEQYCRDSIFVPLGMTNSWWFLDGLNLANIALPYSWNGSFYSTIGHFGYADWPAGELRSNIHDLAQFLISYVHYGKYGGYPMLDSSSVAAMTTLQIPAQSSFMGLTWFRQLYGYDYGWDHSGGDIGVSTRAGFRLSDSTGIAAIMGALFQYAHDYPFNDSDGDGAYDPSDNCPLLSNADQADSDHDRIGDLCDQCPDDPLNDPDSDLVCNSSDNCPDIFNQDQLDTNGDGLGDACCCGRFTGGYTGNVDCSVDGSRNLADITRLIDRVYISKTVLCCEPSGNIDGDPDGRVNLSDITKLIDHTYVSRSDTSLCR